MSDSTRPNFHSNIPQHLLAGETPAMQYLLMELSKNTQATEFLLTQREEAVKILNSVNTKLDYTNGAIGQAKKDIFEIQNKVAEQDKIKDDLNQIISVKRFTERYLINRYILGVAFFLLIGAVKVLSSDELRGYFFKIVGLG